MFDRWLSSEFVMLDANFRLKSKQRNLSDPPLGDGLAYYVENTTYMSHVKASGEQTEVWVPSIHLMKSCSLRSDERMRFWSTRH